MITAYALAAGLNALLAQPLFDDVEAQKLALYEAGATIGDQEVATTEQDSRLDRKITKSFDNVPLSEILRWLAAEGVSFVVRDSEITDSKVTLNFSNEALRDAVNAIADAFGGSWRKRGSVYVLQTGPAMFFGAPAAPQVPMSNFQFEMPKIAQGREFSEADRKAFEQKLKEIEPEIAKLRDMKIEIPPMAFAKVHGDGKMSEQDRKELEKELAKLKDLKIEMPKVDWAKVHDGPMSEEHRRALEKSLAPLKDLKIEIPKMENFRLHEREMTEQERKEFKAEMEKLHKELAKSHSEHSKVFSEQHAKEMKKMAEHMAKTLKDQKGKTFVFERGKPGDKGVHFFTPNGKDVRVFTGPDDMHITAPRFVMTEGNIKKLMGSLTATQKQTMRSKGYIKFSDLNSSQKAMLGDLSGTKNWTVTYVIDGQRLSIKSGD